MTKIAKTVELTLLLIVPIEASDEQVEGLVGSLLAGVKHRIIHIGSGRWVCQVCGKKFAWERLGYPICPGCVTYWEKSLENLRRDT
jgi:hypothetical protein